MPGDWGHSYSRRLPALIWISSLWHSEHWAEVRILWLFPRHLSVLSHCLSSWTVHSSFDWCWSCLPIPADCMPGICVAGSHTSEGSILASVGVSTIVAFSVGLSPSSANFFLSFGRLYNYNLLFLIWCLLVTASIYTKKGLRNWHDIFFGSLHTLFDKGHVGP